MAVVTTMKRSNENGWPSSVLHSVSACMEAGLDRRRLMKLADFIEGLSMIPEWGGDAPGPLGDARHVDGRIDCLGYVLRPGGAGYGTVIFNADRQSDSPAGYYLSGFGLICWGWGAAKGMNAVAASGFVNKLQDVLTAEPVRQGKVPGFRMADVTTAHVADAVRRFVESEEPARAWYMASGLKPANVPIAEPAPVADEAPVAEPVPAAGLTGNEQWKALIVAERFDELRELCEARIGEAETRVRDAEADLEKWRRRLTAAKALGGEGE